MTLDEIKSSDKVLLTAADVAEVLGVDPHGIRIMAREQPERLGFPVTVVGRGGHGVRIPKIPFLKFMGMED